MDMKYDDDVVPSIHHGVQPEPACSLVQAGGEDTLVLVCAKRVTWLFFDIDRKKSPCCCCADGFKTAQPTP